MKTNLLKVAALASAFIIGSANADPIFIDLNNTSATGEQPSSPTASMERLTLAYESHTSIDLTDFTLSTKAGYDGVGADFGYLTSPIYSDYKDMLGNGTANLLGGYFDYLNAPFTGEYATSGMGLTYGLDLDGVVKFDAGVPSGIQYQSGTLKLYKVDFMNISAAPKLLFTSEFTYGGIEPGNQEVGAIIVDETKFETAGLNTFFTPSGADLVSYEQFLIDNPLSNISLKIVQDAQVIDIANDIEIALTDGNNNGVAGVGSIGDTDYVEAVAATKVHISADHSASIYISVPEPTSIALLGLGLMGIARLKRRNS